MGDALRPAGGRLAERVIKRFVAVVWPILEANAKQTTGAMRDSASGRDPAAHALRSVRVVAGRVIARAWKLHPD